MKSLVRDIISPIVLSTLISFTSLQESKAQYMEKDSLVTHINYYSRGPNLDEVVRFTDDFMKLNRLDSLGSRDFSFVRKENCYEFFYRFETSFLETSLENYFVFKDSGTSSRDGLGSASISEKDTLFLGQEKTTNSLFEVLDGVSDRSEVYKNVWSDAAKLALKNIRPQILDLQE